MARGNNPESKSFIVRTLADTPGSPTDFKGFEDPARVVNLTWSPPRVTNGEIDHCNLEYSTLDRDKAITKINVTDSFAIIEDLQVICIYNIYPFQVLSVFM